MSTISDWVAWNGNAVKIDWSLSGSQVSAACGLRLAETLTLFGLGPYACTLNAEARKVGCYIYTPVVAGAIDGPLTYVTSLGVRAIAEIGYDASKVPQEFSWSGSFQMPTNGFIVVYHLLNASGQVLTPAIRIDRIITATSIGNTVADLPVAAIRSFLAGTGDALAPAVSGLVDWVASSLGITKQEATILLIGALVTAVLVVVFVATR